MADIDAMLAQRLWHYARRAYEHSAHLIPEGDTPLHASAGPLMAVEMIGEAMRSAMLGLAALTEEGLGEVEKLPTSLFTIARALQKVGKADISEIDIGDILVIDRIVSAGLERHLIPGETCMTAFNRSRLLAGQMVDALRSRLDEIGKR